MPSRCLVNGIEGAPLDPLDRGLHYGDGVFRTLRVDHGQPRWWPDHLAKLAADAAHLGIPCPDAASWQADLAQLGGRLSGGILKLLVTRGSGQRGYRPPASSQPTRILIHDSTLPLSDAWPAAGINVRFCTLRMAAQPALAGIKHLNRLENVMARAEWDDPDIHEGLLLDTSGQVVCAVMSNLFLWRGGELITPRLDQCGVAGVTRARVMHLAAAAAGMAVRESELGSDDLLAAEEVMLCNSVMGLRRIARLGDRVWPEPLVSPRLQALLDA
jgi:4-amino-4-deoxychorismate lyase